MATKEIKNVKNCSMDTLCKRMIELNAIIKGFETELDSIKSEIKARDTDGKFTFETTDYTVTSRVVKSERLDTKKVKEVLPNWQEYTTLTTSHVVKVNEKKRK